MHILGTTGSWESGVPGGLQRSRKSNKYLARYPSVGPLYDAERAVVTGHPEFNRS